MLTKYFEAKIGQAIHRRVTSGSKDFAGPPYAKQYKAEILHVTGKRVAVNVTVFAITPSGVRDGGFRGKTYLGDHAVSTTMGGLELFKTIHDLGCCYQRRQVECGLSEASLSSLVFSLFCGWE